MSIIRSHLQLNSQDNAQLLSHAQIYQDQLLDGFANESTHLSSLLALGVGGLAYEMGSAATWATLSSRSFQWLPRVFAPVVGLTSEVAAIHSVQRFTHTPLAIESSVNQNSFLSTWIDLGSLKLLGKMGANSNVFAQHFAQSTGMVAAHRLAFLLHLVPPPEGDLCAEFLSAEVVNLQMMAGGLLVNRLTGGRLALLERSFQFSNRALPNTSRMPLESLSETQKLIFFREHFSRLESENIKPEQFDRVMNVLRTSFTHLNEGSAEGCLNEILGRLTRSQEPRLQLRWIVTLQHLLPHLEGAPRLRATERILEALVSPHENLSKVAGECLLGVIRVFPREELVEITSAISHLSFHPGLHTKTVTKLLDRIFDRLEVLRTDVTTDKIQEANLLREYLAHPIFSISEKMSERMMDVLGELPESTAKSIAQNGVAQFSEDTLQAWNWIESANRTLRKNTFTQAWMRGWHEKRAEAAFENIRSRFLGLRVPSEWGNLERQIRSLKSAENLHVLQSSFRGYLLSEDITVQQQVFTWWNNISFSQRKLVLDMTVGSARYFRVKGREANRLRNLASLGLEIETGVASKVADMAEGDDALFVLGTHNSVSVPESFIEEFGISEASRYFMIHHTHPFIFSSNNLNQIYPSTFVEGGGSGDLHALLAMQERLRRGENLALSVTHPLGGSIFVLRNTTNGPEIDIYTAARNTSSSGGSSLNNPQLIERRTRIRNWAQRRGVECRLWEVPFEWVESMQYPDSSRPVDRSQMRLLSH